MANVIALSQCLLAFLPDGNAAEALDAYERWSDRIGHTDRMECLWGLWRLTQEPRHLEEAYGLLVSLCENAPEAYRGTMVERFPLYRDLDAAWRAHTAPDASESSE